MMLRLGDKTFTQEFWIADVTQPILGADFFTANHLAVDLATRRLVSLESGYQVRAELSNSRGGTGLHGVHQAHSRFQAVLEDFPELLVPRFAAQENKHGVEHFIPTEGSPVFARPRRLDPQKLEDAKAEFAE